MERMLDAPDVAHRTMKTMTATATRTLTTSPIMKFYLCSLEEMRWVDRDGVQPAVRFKAIDLRII